MIGTVDPTMGSDERAVMNHGFLFINRDFNRVWGKEKTGWSCLQCKNHDDNKI